MNISSQFPVTTGNSAYDALQTARPSAPPKEDKSDNALHKDAAIMPVDEGEESRGAGNERPTDLANPTSGHSAQSQAGGSSSSNPIVEQIKEMIEKVKEMIARTEAQLASSKARSQGPEDESGQAEIEQVKGRVTELYAQMSSLYGQLADAIKKDSEQSAAGGDAESPLGQIIDTSA